MRGMYDRLQAQPIATPIVLKWGGGVNSTALAVGLHERGERPDFVVFSDTGGEKPETYGYLDVFSRWLAGAGFPVLTVLRYETEAGDKTLEAWCLRVGQLPSRAFGMSSCADKWKIRPTEKWATWEPALRAARAAGVKPVQLLGYDAGEAGRRHKITENDRWRFRAPLAEWDWDRDDCKDAIMRAGLPVPPKSACFYCPSSTKKEVLALERNSPSMFARALALEANGQERANFLKVKGLGRHWSWAELVASATDPVQLSLFPEEPVESCTMCST